MRTGDGSQPVAAERLQKFLARAGVASRRAAEDLIRQGRVAVNGKVVSDQGFKVVPGDAVSVDGRPVVPVEKLVYLVLNKPRGYVATVSDPWGRPTVRELIPVQQRVYPVGRLDVDSQGLLLLTNDGQLAYHLTHPRYGVEKEYQVLAEGKPSEDALERLRRGVELEGRSTAPATVRRLRSVAGDTWLAIVIHEGRKRQIRRMVEAVGHRVKRLVRVRFGPIRLGELGPGEYRQLTPSEVGALKDAIVSSGG